MTKRVNDVNTENDVNYEYDESGAHEEMMPMLQNMKMLTHDGNAENEEMKNMKQTHEHATCCMQLNW